MQSPRGKAREGLNPFGGGRGRGGKRSLVKNTRVTRSFTRGATSVACWSRRRERERGCFMAEHSLVIEYFGRGGNEERAALLLVACFRLAPLNVTISRTCSMRRHVRPRTSSDKFRISNFGNLETLVFHFSRFV